MLCAVTTGRSVSSVPATPPIEADFRASHDGWGQGAVLGQLAPLDCGSPDLAWCRQVPARHPGPAT